MSRVIFAIYLLAVFTAITLGISTQAEEAAQVTSSPAIGTGVGVSRINAQIATQDPPLRPIREKLRSQPLSTDYIEEALDARITGPLQFQNQPLSEVIQFIQDEYELPIVIDVMKLDEVAISPDTEVTVNIENVSLRSALNLILQQPGLEDICFAVLNEVLTITTKYGSAESMYVRVYPTDDFVYSNGYPNGGAISWAEYSPLASIIYECVSPETWEENGEGEGQIQVIKPGLLIVRQEYRVHVEIEKLLNDLRTELRVMEKELGRDALQETGRYYGRPQAHSPNTGSIGGRGISAQ